MAKIKLNPIVEEVSGGFGNIVFRASKGKTVMCRKPDVSGNDATEGQAAHRERFRKAVAYGRSVMADAEMLAMYKQASERRDIPVFALTVADFFNAPTINDVDLSTYTGKAGDVITVNAMDDFGVAKVHVALTQVSGGTPIESGYAVETAAGSGVWVYTAKLGVSAGSNVNVNVVATDHPGGTALDSFTKTI
jgi:hypothetical protein